MYYLLYLFNLLQYIPFIESIIAANHVKTRYVMWYKFVLWYFIVVIYTQAEMFLRVGITPLVIVLLNRKYARH